MELQAGVVHGVEQPGEAARARYVAVAVKLTEEFRQALLARSRALADADADADAVEVVFRPAGDAQSSGDSGGSGSSAFVVHGQTFPFTRTLQHGEQGCIDVMVRSSADGTRLQWRGTVLERATILPAITQYAEIAKQRTLDAAREKERKGAVTKQLPGPHVNGALVRQRRHSKDAGSPSKPAAVLRRRSSAHLAPVTYDVAIRAELQRRGPIQSREEYEALKNHFVEKHKEYQQLCAPIYEMNERFSRLKEALLAHEYGSDGYKALRRDIERQYREQQKDKGYQRYCKMTVSLGAIKERLHEWHHSHSQRQVP